MLPPIRLAGAAVVLGAALACVVPLRDDDGAGAVVAALAAALVALAGLRGTRRDARGGRRAALACVAAAALLASWARASIPRAGALSLPAHELAALEGRVLTGPDPLRPDGAPDADPMRRFALRVGLDGAEARVVLRVPAADGAPDLLPGDRVRVVGRARPRGPPTNPGTGRPAGGVPLVDVSGASVTRLPDDGLGPGDRLRRVAERLRTALRDRVRDACGGETSAYGVLLCLLTGDRSALPPGVARAFRDSGTAHLLAVSGLHLVLLVELAAAVARRVVPARLRRRTALPAILVLVSAYAALCRFEVPVVRSAVFLVVAAAARTASRRTSTLDHLALAAGLVTAWEPSQVRDTGFLLSFSAVAGISTLAARFREALFPRLAIRLRFPESMTRTRRALLRSLSRGLATSCAAQAATAPVVAATFGAAQPLGPLANLVAVPLFAGVLPTAFLLAACGGAAPSLTKAVAEAAAAVFVGVAEIGAAVPFGHVAMGAPPAAAVALSTALLVAAALCGPWTRRTLLLPGAAWALVALGAAADPPRRADEVVVLDVGHGLCVLVRAADGTTLLYDAGGRAPDVGERTVVPALRALGVGRIDLLCVSHEDVDHCSAVADVLRELSVDRVVVAAGFGVSPVAAALRETLDAAGVPVVHALRGDRFAVAGISARVLGPAATAVGGAENADSLVLHVEASDGALTALLPGDVEGPSLHALTADPDLPPADVLLLPHHGRGDAARHAELAARCRARVLVASDSEPAPFAAGRAWITSVCGAVRIRADAPPEAWPW